MECPDCKSRSVIIKDGQKRCEAQGCLYLQFSVITYENENRQFQGEKGTQNRFNSINYNAQNGEKQLPKYQKNFDRSASVIKQLIRAMKLSQNLKDIAQLKLKEVLKIKYPEDKEKIIAQQKDPKQKLQVADKYIAAYCLWLACVEKKMQFKDVRIANQMGISKTQWLEIHTKMQNKFKTEAKRTPIIVIPQMNPQFYIRRICRKRKIDKIQQDAMLQMAKNIREAQKIGGKKNATVAACIFWQIMLRSSFYNADDKFDIKLYLQKSGKYNDETNHHQKYWTQTQFDISFEAIKKFKNEELEPNLQYYIPQFSRKKPYHDEKAKREEEKNKN